MALRSERYTLYIGDAAPGLWPSHDGAAAALVKAATGVIQAQRATVYTLPLE